MNFLSLLRPLGMQTPRIVTIMAMLALCLAVLFGAEAYGQAVQAKVATGSGHGAWLKPDGTLWMWGSNGAGQLANDGDDWLGPPAQAPGMTGVKDVACGEYSTVVLKNDGTVWVWGGNEHGELGNGTIEASAKPAQLSGLTGVTAVAASGANAFALKSDGTVWHWGGNIHGTLTQDDQGYHWVQDPSGSRPERVPGIADAVAVASGSGRGLALKADGTVWVWGQQSTGDSGGGSTGNPNEFIKVNGFADVAAMAAGDEFILAVKKDGTVWAIGQGAAGQLGNGGTQGSAKPVMVSGLTGVKAVAAGSMHAMALKADGTVWDWGYNHEGQLGVIKEKSGKAGESVSVEMSAKPVRPGALSDVIAIAAAQAHSVALTGQGTVWAWGDNTNGALGTDTERLEYSEVPMKVGESMPDKCNPLFACVTHSGKYIQICGEQNGDDSDKWSNIQYRFGPDHGPPELLFPKDPAKGEPSLFFSHEMRKNEYRVSVSFTSGIYSYQVYSTSKGEHEGSAGVTVKDSKGKLLTDIACSERPLIYIDYLRMALPCDMKNPHGAAACKESPYKVK